MEKNLGGDRLGSGAKIKVDLHNWGRSSFNQSRIWRSTMGIGVGTPCFTEIGTNGTTFDIDINTLAHTIPTISPLFGAFKLQVDMFACPIRLYQGLLHNNAVNIGLKMAQVLLPNITLGKYINSELIKKSQTNPSSLLNYIGIKGYHSEKNTFNALPILAYYDIFKNYYSNKQEEYAKVINNILIDKENYPALRAYLNNNSLVIDATLIQRGTEKNPNKYELNQPYDIINNNVNSLEFYFFEGLQNVKEIKISGNYETPDEPALSQIIEITIPENGKKIDILFPIPLSQTIANIGTLEKTTINGIDILKFEINRNTLNQTLIFPSGTKLSLYLIQFYNYYNDIEILNFKLDEIDKARRTILKNTNLLERINLNEDLNFLPYSTNFEEASHDYQIEWKHKNMQGLWLKTYQSDIFNNWLNTDQIDLINEISSIAVQTTENGNTFSMDALILAKKVYNVLNRIVVSGGTYEDWQESVYGENSLRRAESPIYIGGASAIINFEEVVSTAGSDANGTEQVLGTLGGKGILTDRKGGSIIYKCEEPTIIMGIASITPLIDYSQGNKWYVTDLDNMDNLHKPGLDGIGFQNLIANNVHWAESPNKALAKQPAWIHYQTAYNEDFGQFAYDPNQGDISLAQMVLNRNYEVNENGEIQDFTTYIDPSKYNYAFADPSITAQNFWVQLGFNVVSRRKMAAFEIPNL